MSRMTRQKKAILEELQGLNNHPTADEIYHAVRKRLPRISLGTVYRNLDMMSRHGLIRTLEGPGLKRYDGEVEEHCHARCESCGRISDVERELAQVPELPLTTENGFRVTDFRVEFVGLCRECSSDRFRGCK